MNKELENLYSDNILQYFLMSKLDSLIEEYDNFDAAHSHKHVKSVLSESLRLARQLDVERLDIVAAVAIYHDLGLKYGREGHEIKAGIMVRNDQDLKVLLSDDDIEIIAQAVEDHRASSRKKARSIYGKIVSDADREYDFDIIVTRCINYRPELCFEDNLKEAIRHISDKYAKGGYLPPFYYDKVDNIIVAEKLDRFAKDKKFAISEFKRIWDSLKCKDTSELVNSELKNKKGGHTHA